MIIPDALISWPKHVDYPLFRYNLKRFREYFGKVYIALLPGLPERDFSDFLINTMDDVTFLKPPHYHDDWRQNAVLDMLRESSSSHVLFLEQDFMFHSEKLLQTVCSADKPFIGYLEDVRVHPAFALVARSLLDKTSLNFAADPPLYDHFGHVFAQILEIGDGRFIQDMGFQEKKDYYHMGGLTQNYHCFAEGQPFYKPKEFLTYNHLVQNVRVVQSPLFIELCQQIEKKHGVEDVRFIDNFFRGKDGEYL